LRLEEISLNHMIPFMAMVEDFQKNDPDSLSRILTVPAKWDAAGFRKFALACEKERLDWKPGPNRVSKSHYVLLDELGEVAGYSVMNFPLDEQSEVEGGNVRFVTPPAKRGGMNEAHTLNKMLFEAVRAGLARILVTCFEGDEIHRQAIEMNRGEFQDAVPSPSEPGRFVRRYWIRFR
jgi:predicted acetyltransferase